LAYTLIAGLLIIAPRNLFAQQGSSFFARGADISWLPQMEASGYHFYNNKGKQQDCLKF
jgi:arabinogalactan endo-1,4-beta-galactosidase